MKEKFVDRRMKGAISIVLDKDTGRVWKADKEVLANWIIVICNEYVEQGYTMTLRQLYYQLVARDVIPNHMTVYKKLSSIKDDLCYSGLLDWSIFEDRGRVPIKAYHEDDIPSALDKTLKSYRLDRQLNQPVHIEVWTEKDAISGVLKQVTHPLTIRLVVNKGYNSSTAMYAAYKRFKSIILNGQSVRVLYFGDHDPSGLDMVRDIYERLIFMFVNGSYDRKELIKICEWGVPNYDLEDAPKEVRYAPNHNLKPIVNAYDRGELQYLKKSNGTFSIAGAMFYAKFKVEQIGLTYEQIQKYQPPHNPAKLTDPRAKDYIKQFGGLSWEVDALPPAVMQEIVSGHINQLTDFSLLEEVLEREEAEKATLAKLIEQLKQ